jgi:uncharacterized short protein YbdD (DUF466 family)
MDLEFDIVIPVGPHDIDNIHLQLEHTKQNVIGYRNIYLICKDPLINIEGAITIDENIYPFTKEDILNIIKTGRENINDRTGWFFQQLLKLYAGNIIPGILKRYLIIDADTHFLKPIKFITDEGQHMFTCSNEFFKEYFEHMTKLHPELKKYHELSGISHHAFFHTDRINELMSMVEKYHANKQFWIIFLENVAEMLKISLTTCVCSEYEIYFNFMYHFHPDEIIIRKLNWSNLPYLNAEKDDDFQSVHWYLR